MAMSELNPLPPVDQTLDLSGLNCPLPILRTKKALAVLASGNVVAVTATDPAAPADFAAFCKQTGHTLLRSETLDNGKFWLVLQRR